MAVTTLIPVEEYLRTVYRPDCDYVDGQLVERNVGEIDHSDALVTFPLEARYQGTGWSGGACPGEARQVSCTRCGCGKGNEAEPKSADGAASSGCGDIFAGRPDEQYVATDRRVYTTQGSVEAKDGVMRAGELEIPLAAIVEG